MDIRLVTCGLDGAIAVNENVHGNESMPETLYVSYMGQDDDICPLGSRGGEVGCEWCDFGFSSRGGMLVVSGLWWDVGYFEI